MNCNKCGKEISEENKFCSNCGNELLKTKDEETKNTSNVTENLKDTTKENIKTKKWYKNKKIILTLVGLILVCIFMYIQSYNKHFTLSKSAYDSKNYSYAADQISKLLPLSPSDAKEFKKIKFMGKCYSDLGYAKANIENGDAETNLRRLLQGYEYNVNNLELAKKYKLTDNRNFTDIQQEYLKYLSTYFNMSSYKVDKLLKSSDKDKEIKAAASDLSASINIKKYNEINPIQFKEVVLTSNSIYSQITGTVTNVSSKKVEFIKVKGLFKDKNGSVIDTDWTYAVGEEGLAPNESKKFTLSVSKDKNIEAGNVELMKY
ncbi:FxLYD domain-containing protein [Clostridium sp. UBA1652]|uniref:FxLYD domain-containing protein n=1 Tax=Clostridium sp. UBA1652 TaxID=1946348 RepID=UPI00257FBE72|nr:FxLYD domain-containing protein [Clostridium sp. UBA1652]